MTARAPASCSSCSLKCPPLIGPVIEGAEHRIPVPDRDVEETGHRGMIGGKTHRAGRRGQLVESDRRRLADGRSEDAPPARRVPGPVDHVRRHTAVHELFQSSAVRTVDADRRIAGLEQIAPGVGDALQHHRQAQFGGGGSRWRAADREDSPAHRAPARPDHASCCSVASRSNPAGSAGSDPGCVGPLTCPVAAA